MMNRTTYTYLLLIVILLGFSSCKKGDDYYKKNQLKYTEYDGTSLDFLKSQGTIYDSLLLILDRVPDVRNRLDDPSDKTTFFAMTNSSFSNALDAMNTVRQASNKKALYLNDIPELLLDTLTYHYTFDGVYDTPLLKEFVEGKVIRAIDDYRMTLMYKVTSASGIVNAGQQQIVLSDMNNSIFKRYWQESTTSVVNIRTRNGMLHILSPSHNFGFSKLTKLLNK